MTLSGRPVTAASDVIGIEDVFDARIASRGQRLVGSPEDRLLHADVLDDRFDEEVGGDDVVDGRHAGEDVLRRRPALLGELREALLHRRRAPVGRAGQLVVQRDAPARRRDHLRDPAAHLARADDEDVLELHDAAG